MERQKIDREKALTTLAEEIDLALRVGPVAHIKHQGVPYGQHDLGCLESHLLGIKNGEHYSLHDWAYYRDIKAPSIIFPDRPRGFFITLKTDSEAENLSRDSKIMSIPPEAKMPNYNGDYIKIDWVYPHKSILGLGIPRRYFYAVECAAKKAGFPSLHIDANHHGVAYWSRKEFGLKIPKDFHAGIIELYEHFIKKQQATIEYAKSISPYSLSECNATLPKDIDLNKPYTIPRLFMEIVGAIYMAEGFHLHFYKKF